MGEIELDPAARRVRFHGEQVELSVRELALLQELMLNAGRVLSREQLSQRLYSWGEEIESNAIEVHVHHLRRKLAPELVRTVRGVAPLAQYAALLRPTPCRRRSKSSSLKVAQYRWQGMPDSSPSCCATSSTTPSATARRAAAWARDKDSATLTVSDAGPGIPADERSKVGQRFYRILGSEEFGSGLGLSIVKRIAELHGASLSLRDGAQGKGLEVAVRFAR